MKKILLAASALALTAGAAAADIRWSGNARFGVDYDSTRAEDPVDDRWQTHTRFRLQLDVSTTTDTGLTFGARQRFQVVNGAGSTGNQVRFFAQYEGLTVAFGNIFGVIESMPNLYITGTPSAGVGLTGNGFYSLAANTVSNGGVFGWTLYSSGGLGARNGVEAIYTFGDFTIHGHVTDDRTVGVVGTLPGDPTPIRFDTVPTGEIDEDGNPITELQPVFEDDVDVMGRTGSRSAALGVSGTFADITVGLGYERWRSGSRDGDNILFASAGYDLGEGNVSLSYARTNYNDVRATKWSLSGGWNVMPDLYGYGFVARENNDVGTSFGLGGRYLLGGGASLEAGYTRGRTAGGDNVNVFSAGVFFSF